MIKNIKKIIHLILIVANAVAAILFLIAAFSSYIAPAKATIPILLGLLYPVLLVGNLVFLVYWILLRRRWWLLSVVSLLIGWGSVQRYFPVHFFSGNVEKEEKSLRILSYNVFMFDEMRPHLPNNPHPLLEYVRRQDPDIVCFQEYATSANPKRLTPKQVRSALSAYPYVHRSRSLACFSKYPIVASTEIDYPTEGGNCTVAYTINVAGEKIELINNHLESNRFTAQDKAIYRDMITNVEPGLWEKMKNNLLVKMIKSTRIRAKQAEAIAAYIAKKGGSERMIVCGDFNDTPMSYIYQTIRGDMKDAYIEQGFGPGITYHANAFWFRIDHVLYGSHFTAVDSHIDRVDYSDHYPLMATLKWRKSEE